MANGVVPAYQPIVLVDSKAHELHGIADDTLLNALLVCDVGCAFRGYKSDRTQTFVLKPTSENLKWYSLLRTLLEFVAKQVRPGQTFSRLNSEMENFIFQNWSFLSKEEQRGFLRHSVGHHVGLETHDPEILPMGPNNVIALEVGYYNKDINLRLENMYQVTEWGCEAWSDVLPVQSF